MARTEKDKSLLLDPPLRLLIVDDNPMDVELVVAALKRADYPVTFAVADSSRLFEKMLVEADYDLILADHNLGDWTGLDALAILQRSGKDIPFVVVTATLGDEAAVEYLKRGAADYVLKHQLERLPVAVDHVLRDQAHREESKRLQVVIQRGKREWELTFDSVPDPMFLLDEQCLVKRANRAATRILGLEFAQLIGKPCYEVLHASPEPGADCPHKRMLQTGKEERGDLEETRLGKFFDVTTTPLYDRDGVLRGSVHVMRDITDRKRAEDALKASENRYRGLFEDSPISLALEDFSAVKQFIDHLRESGVNDVEAYFKGRRGAVKRCAALVKVIDVNRATLELYEAESKDRLLRGLDAAFTEESYDALRQELIAISKGETSCETETIGRTKSGKTRNFAVKWSVAPGYEDTLARVFVSVMDITARKGAENALRESERRFRELVKNATYGIYHSTVEGKFIDVNPALVAMLGYGSEAELLALNPSADLYWDPGQRGRLVEEQRQTGRLRGVEVEWKRKDGKPITVRLSGRAMRDKQGTVEGFEVIAEDVTERRALEKQLRQAQKFEAIGQLAGGVAHDFNNVVGAMMGWADLGLLEAPAESRLRSCFEKIRDQARRAAGLTRQLLAFARRQVLQPRSINLNQTAADVVSLLEKVLGAHIEVKTVLAPDLEAVRADPTHIEQVLMNLCVNARDAMPRGGRLVIETRNVSFTQEDCQRRGFGKPGSYVLLAVSDTGVGMDAATLERIFEPFFTTKEVGKGTGLGLSVVYGIVKQHDGFINVYSEPGRGSTFSIYLPASAQIAGEAEQTKIEPVQGGSETILLAEDHEGVRDMSREMLARLGYQVLLAADGEEAVQMVEAHRDRIDLVLLDVVLPKLSGPEAYARICAMKPDVAVILTTGYTAEAPQLNDVAGKGVAILQKPYCPDDLARKVRETLDHARLGAR